MNVLICGGVFMVKQQPNRKGQAADAVRSGSVMAGASLLLALPAALLIREGVLPETSVQLTALVCAGLAALLSECLCFGKRRGGYAYIPLSALAAALILLLVGACLPMRLGYRLRFENAVRYDGDDDGRVFHKNEQK